MKTAVCCIIKDENEYVEEWVKYHNLIGFDHFFIYDNDSKISPMENLGNFKDIITYTKWPGYYVGRQFACYLKCVKENIDYDWIAFIDIDEFIVLLEDSVNIKDYLERYNDFGAIGLNWLMFGPSGHTKKQKSVIYSYKESFPQFSENKHVKSIAQPKKINTEKIVFGAPHVFKCETVNVKKKKFNGPFSTPIVIDEVMRINHYCTRSEEDFAEKIKRGGGNSIGRKNKINELEKYKDTNTSKPMINNRIIEVYEKSISNNNM